jgi:hypothetical protein
MTMNALAESLAGNNVNSRAMYKNLERLNKAMSSVMPWPKGSHETSG